MKGAARAFPHLRRLWRRGSATAIGEALVREARIRGRARLVFARLARARTTGEPVLVGPFLGEIGFETLYWIPFLRRVLGRYGIDPARVTAISRGGAEGWYAGIAERYVDLFDLLTPEQYAERLASRRREVGDSKQLTVAPLDRDLVALAQSAGERPSPLQIHPSLLFTRLRYFWAGERDIESALRWMRFAPLQAGGEIPAGAPDRYVVVKAYFSDCLPRTDANRAYLRELVAALAEGGQVVLLPSSFRFDDHAAPSAAELPGVHEFADAELPRTNLAVQSALVAGAEALVGTYGGFSYLAPMLGVPSATVYSEANFNPTHLEVMRVAARALAADYRVESTSSVTPRALAEAVWSGSGGAVARC